MDKERARRLFLTAFFLFALANGLSGSIISNYFKDVFQVDSVQRGLLEIPRELPGVVGVFVIAALPSLGNVSLSVLGFALYCVGLLVLGLFSPGYFVMQLFVFTYSLGDHMVMPIRDAIAMDLADEGKTGTFLGRYRGMMTLGSMLASALVFVGFRAGFFYFRTGVIPSFCAALVFLGMVVTAVFWMPALMKGVGALASLTGPSATVAHANIQKNQRRIAATGAALLIGVTLVSTIATGAASAKETMNGALATRYSVDIVAMGDDISQQMVKDCLLYTSPSPRD